MSRSFIIPLTRIGSFAVWEAANIWIVENPQMRMQRRKLTKLTETEVQFTVLEND